MSRSSRSHRSLSPKTVVSLKWWRSVALLLALFVVAQGSIVRDEATLSGLVFTNVTNDEEPQWNDQEIPPLLAGWRSWHASVVVESPENEEDQTMWFWEELQNLMLLLILLSC